MALFSHPTAYNENVTCPTRPPIECHAGVSNRLCVIFHSLPGCQYAGAVAIFARRAASAIIR
ncbi:MAG: hypothetical protein KC519_15750, partial [Anaerolineae bacterium]|nr:hypothetical protein [Anaerolineae bacterium]